MKYIPNKVSRAIGGQILKTQQNAPTLLFVGGVVGAVGATVLACKATLKLEEIVNETEEKLELVKNFENDKYSEKDRQKDVGVVYAQSALKIIKLYSPALVVGGLSIAALTKSHNILNKRNAGLVAAYKLIEKSFDEYRERVVADLGEEKDREYSFGVTERQVVETDKHGDKITTVKGPRGTSRYAQWFSYENSGEWRQTHEFNKANLWLKQSYLNDKLKSRGHVFLNDVLDVLDIDRTTEGAVVGWRYKDGIDGFIDFGCFEHSDAIWQHRMGENGAILLDFNVDGIIYDKI